ncbi:outer membrane transport energization protein ExbB [Pseudomonas helmanticensis]|uniref:Outer membrane transport energization protein ExbB n=1 Tax=Pseudomonas helmanticensis TaxID=1471381 RepID=A0A4R7V1P6_9PSED|nr:MotA/TolQ/ExbB proton channel family protein [Pseudomonas helmanticensis]TDV42442.1 outer membrane transport energization protein ExbB [Pseudomonas helmanticensis]
MQRLFLSLLICLGFVLPATAQAWWQDDWHYRKQIAVDTTPQGAAINQALGRTALLVRLHTGNFTFDGVKEDGGDLRFVAADDKTVLNHQIESFDALMGMALIWVDVPNVEGGQRQDIWMYYGNQKAPATGNGQLTFDPNYTALYHFDGATGTPAKDTTAYGNTAQSATGAAIDGVVGRALQFSGQPLLLPASPSLQHNAGSAFTFSAWLRLDQASGEQLILARREGANSLLIGANQGVPFVEIDGQRAVATQALNPGQWQHVALTAEGAKVTLYINGREGATLAQAMPAFNSVMAIGADLHEGSFQPFVGAIDELRLSKVARPAALLLADATSQGAESKLVAYGVDEEQSGFGFGSLGFLLNAVPIDAWVIIAVLVLMMFQSWIIMLRKNRSLSRVSAANEDFRVQFAKVGTRLEMFADDAQLAQRLQHSSLWRLYLVAVKEIRTRREQGADTSSVSAATIEAIRCSMDGVRTRENQQLSSKLSTLSNAIAGGPYIGLLGTVLGIMVVFLGTAMAGDVNINAIAPGMAAALLATAMGLFVAIPALFGYNRLITRNKEVSADMRVFVDEFITRLAEMHGVSQFSEASHQRGHHANHSVPA